MSSALVAALLANAQTNVDPNQALIVFGLQNDFIGPTPILPLPLESGWVERIKELIPTFRDYVGDVIFVRSEVDSDALRNLDKDKVIMDSSDTDTGTVEKDSAELEDEDEEDKSPSKKKKNKKKKKKRDVMAQFLKDLKRKDSAAIPADASRKEIEEIYQKLTNNGPAALPGSDGAAFRADIQALIKPEDMVLVKRNFSAFKGTDLLVQLRMRRITELFLVGCMTNLSVFATAQEAASHGMILNIVEDTMGYRTQKRHDTAMRTMIEHMGAHITTSSAIHAFIEESLNAESGVATPAAAIEVDDSDDISAALSKLGLNGSTHTPGQSRDLSVTELAEALASSSLNRRSINSPQQKSASRPPTSHGSSEAQSPLSSKNLRSSKSSPNIRGNVRVRVRKRNEAELPHVPELPKTAALHNKTLSREDEQSKMIQSILESRENKERNGSPRKHGEVTAYQPPLSDENGTTRTLILDHEEPYLDRKRENPQSTTTPTTSKSPIASIENKSKQSVAQTTSPHSDQNTQSSQHFLETMKNPLKNLNKKFKNLSNLPALGPDDCIGEGDSSIKYDLLGKELRDEINPDVPLRDTIFRAIYHEVQWQKMYHAAGEVPRLVAVQGAVAEDGSKPVYRHPSDQSPPLLPFTKYVDIVRKEAEKVVGHELNHVLIQLYRSGQDYISEHSDKTLDIKKGSSIVNASFGAQRTMRLRTKRSAKTAAEEVADETASTVDATMPKKGKGTQAGVERVTQRIHMPHNSLFVLGLKTNRYWLHGINQDKRAERDRGAEELANNGMRISLTFRLIDTFLSKDEQYIWGQGAKSKAKEDAGKCINADEAEAEKLIDAFGFENREGLAFQWDEIYGHGFDVLNMRAAPPQAKEMPAEKQAIAEAETSY